MRKDIEKISDKVHYILENYEVTRDNDKLLWLGVMANFYDLKSVLGDKYEDFRSLLLSKNTPSMESIRRAGQKLKEYNVPLRGKFYKKRKEESENMKDWAVGK